MKKGMVSYRAIFAEKEYMKIICANLINRFGDSIDAIAFGWMVYQLTASEVWLAVIMGVNMVPTVLFQPIAGALVNFFDKKKGMVLCDVGRGLLVFLIAALFITGALNPWLVMLIAFLNSTLEAFRVPCGLAIVPKVLPAEKYSFGISLNQGLSRGSELVGLAAAGILIAWIGIGGAIIIDAVTFLISAFLLSFLRPEAETGKKEILTIRESFSGEFRSGLHYFLQNKAFLVITAVCFFSTMLVTPWDSLKAAYVSDCLRFDAQGLSIGGVCLTAGTMLGIFVTPYLTSRIQKKWLLILPNLLIGLLYLFLAVIIPIEETVPRLVLYGSISACYGILNAMIDVALSVIFMSTVDADYMGRVGGLFNALASMSAPLASFLLAGITGFFTIPQIYAAMPVFSAVIFLCLTGTKGFRFIKDTARTEV